MSNKKTTIIGISDQNHLIVEELLELEGLCSKLYYIQCIQVHIGRVTRQSIAKLRRWIRKHKEVAVPKATLAWMKQQNKKKDFENEHDKNYYNWYIRSKKNFYL